jgi:hypothetical protein
MPIALPRPIALQIEALDLGILAAALGGLLQQQESRAEPGVLFIVGDFGDGVLSVGAHAKL